MRGKWNDCGPLSTSLLTVAIELTVYAGSVLHLSCSASFSVIRCHRGKLHDD